MKMTRFLALCAVLTAVSCLPGRSPAEEPDAAEEGATKSVDESPSTDGQTTAEAGAPAVDEPAPVKRAKRPHKQPKPRAAPRDPDGDGGGGGGGGVAQEPTPAPADDGPDFTPPTGAPSPESLTCDMPPLHHINVHFMGGNGNRLRADSTPIVCSTDPGTKHERYCQKTMNDPNRRCCPAKPEGHPMRVACELVLLGKDRSDGVAGPRWQYVGNDPNGGVEKHGENPFLAFAYGRGIARACSNVVNVCGEAAYSVR